jgi:aminoglycoside phosphotransferase (APT) family kinase protein
VLASWTEARAVKTVLGAVRIASRRELQRRRNRYTVVLELGEGSRCVLKWLRDAEAVQAEAVRLAAANALGAIETPRLLGVNRHCLVQEFVAGDSLDALARSATPIERARLVARGARVLAAIHAAKLPASSPLALAESAAPARLLPRLREAWASVRSAGFARWQALHGELPEAWRGCLDDARLEELARELAASGKACVLGHGDFHPRHLLLTPEGTLCVVDWSAMALVSPWLELGQLLRWSGGPRREIVIEAYREEAEARGVVRGISAARARELANGALTVARLLVAKQMVRKLGAGPKPAHLEIFRANLDGLAESR